MGATRYRHGRTLAPAMSVVAALVLGACPVEDDGDAIDAGDDGADAGLDGPCVHIFEEPVLHIEDARGGASDEPIAEIEIWDIEIDDTPVDPEAILAQWHEDDDGLEYDDATGRLICTIPCAMGTQAGEWSFSAYATGYADEVVTASARYDEHEGGCPSHSDGGTRIDVVLDPE